MADAGFNGTTLKIESQDYKVLSCSYSEDVGKVDVTPGDELSKVYVPGKINKSADFKLRGAAPPSRGTSGTVEIAWNDDGQTSTFEGYVSTSTITGQAEGAIDSDVTIKPILVVA